MSVRGHTASVGSEGLLSESNLLHKLLSESADDDQQNVVIFFGESQAWRIVNAFRRYNIYNIHSMPKFSKLIFNCYICWTTNVLHQCWVLTLKLQCQLSFAPVQSIVCAERLNLR